MLLVLVFVLAFFRFFAFFCFFSHLALTLPLGVTTLRQLQTYPNEVVLSGMHTAEYPQYCARPNGRLLSVLEVLQGTPERISGVYVGTFSFASYRWDILFICQHDDAHRILHSPLACSTALSL